MELTPSQLSSLNDMGIPVWALRGSDSECSSGAEQYAASCDCLVLIESHNDEQKYNRLLNAMLFAIGLKAQDYECITVDQLSQLQNTDNQKRVLLVFGEQLAQSLWGRSVIRGEPHRTVNSEISTVVSFSLNELLSSPQNKALAWHDLQLAKELLNAV